MSAFNLGDFPKLDDETVKTPGKTVLAGEPDVTHTVGVGSLSDGDTLPAGTLVTDGEKVLTERQIRGRKAAETRKRNKAAKDKEREAVVSGEGATGTVDAPLILPGTNTAALAIGMSEDKEAGPDHEDGPEFKGFEERSGESITYDVDADELAELMQGVRLAMSRLEVFLADNAGE